MQNLNQAEISEYIAENIVGKFYQSRLDKLNEIQLSAVLKRKNPYLFKAKNITTAEAFVKEILNAHLSSQEETIFGGYLEDLAIFICSKVYSGRKSSAEGIDLEFERESIKYIVTIKSGPYWANSGQIERMKENFRKAKRILGTNSSIRNIVAVNGCCYGQDPQPDKGEYLKLCGQEFWNFISGDIQLYKEVIKPLGDEAKEKDEDFTNAYDIKVNKLTKEFLDQFCSAGVINWEKLLEFNSGKK
jgi:hypothetical protein